MEVRTRSQAVGSLNMVRYDCGLPGEVHPLLSAGKALRLAEASYKRDWRLGMRCVARSHRHRLSLTPSCWSRRK
jgi:hypothetical protein